MPTDTDPDLLASRYGTRRPIRRAVGVTVVVLLVGAALGWLGWAAWVNSDVPIKAEVATFDVVDAHRVDATLQVRLRDRAATGTCLVRATATDHTIVGEQDLRIEGAGSGTRPVSLRTERRATTVEVVRCTAD